MIISEAVDLWQFCKVFTAGKIYQKVVIPMWWNEERPKRKALSKLCALLLAAVMLVSPLLADGAYAQAGGNNAVVHSASITATDSATYLTLVTSEQVNFIFRYNRNEVSIYVVGAGAFPGAVSIGSNPIFTSGRWAGNTLHLTLTTMDGIMGYRSFWDQNDNLVIRFRNPPSSLAVTRVAIDPGHGGLDRGAEGFRTDLPEAVINRQMSQLLAEELRRRGVTVLVLDTAPGMEISERVRRAEEFDADIFISVHNNAARNANARGTEVYFYSVFSHVMAATTARNVSTNLGTINRGTRRASFSITRSSQFISVMVEAGFVTNREEYEKLITPSYQQRIAVGIADAVVAVVTHSYPGTGRQFS